MLLSSYCHSETPATAATWGKLHSVYTASRKPPCMYKGLGLQTILWLAV
jgi:hypothetical protein